MLIIVIQSQLKYRFKQVTVKPLIGGIKINVDVKVWNFKIFTSGIIRFIYFMYQKG